MVRNWNKTINELLPYFKGLSNNVIINNDGHYSLPSYDTEENILTITELCETTLLLFSAYQSNSKKIKKILLLYLLIELNLDRCNLTNAERLLDELNREIARVGDIKHIKNIDSFFEVLLLFLVGHELKHAHYNYNYKLKDEDIKSVKSNIISLYSSSNTLKEKQIYSFILEMPSEDSQIEELACDIGSIKIISDYINDKHLICNIKEICTQIIRTITMLQCVKNLKELAEFDLRKIKSRIKKLAFDIARVGNVALALSDYFDADKTGNLKEILLNEVFAYNKFLTNSLKIGLSDLWILGTAQADKMEEDAERYEAICFQYKELAQHIKKLYLMNN